MLANVGVFLAVASALCGAPDRMINESAREIPVAYDVDVAVVGGSSGAVSAAVAAAQAGARVFLAAPRPYLGEDLCASYRLWLEPGETPDSPLAEALFSSPLPPLEIAQGLPFRYTADPPSAALHRDSDPPRMLMDGKAHNAVSDSVQFDGNVDITAELTQETSLAKVHALVFQRRKQFEVARMSVAMSDDGQQWQPAGVVENPRLKKEDYENVALLLSVPVAGKAKYVRITLEKSPEAQRILVGEIVLEGDTGERSSAAPEGRIPPMPMQVKRTLDKALLDAGISFLYGCYATDLLRDQSGNLAGIVMANRSGRQAVRAKCVIDATPRAAVARMAGAVFTVYPAGEQTFRRVVAGPGLVPIEGVPARKLPAPLQIEQGGWSANAFYDAYEYTLTLPMRNGSYASFAEAEQAARDRTWSPKQNTSSESVFQVPPDKIRGKKQAGASWEGPANTPLEAFQPEGAEWLYVLGGCADLPRDSAEKMLRPLAFLKIGERIGRAAAECATAAALSGDVRVAGEAASKAGPGDIREVLNGTRPIQAGLPTIRSGARSVPILAEYDVVVVGGGTGGAPAGIAAARQGAKTLVVEYLDGLGGVGTLGLIGTYYYGFLEGFTGEVDRGVASMDGQERPPGKSWNVEWKMEWYRRELRKAGADIWFGVLGCGVVQEGNRVTGVVVATPEGRGVVLAKNVIDATGNSDVAFAAGAACMAVGEDNVAMQGTGLPPRKPGQSYTNTDYTLTDDSDVVDAWRTYVSGRAKYADTFDLGVIIDSRERRRIVGDFIISPLDIWNQRTYPDSVGLSRSNFDTHGFTVHDLFALQTPHKDEVFAYTPYRSLLPKGIEGVLVTGLGISAHRDAMPILRMQGDIQNQGYAAGTAAAMAARAGVGLRDIDVKELQQRLVKKGNLPASVLNDKDSYPLPPERIKAAVDNAASGYTDVAVILAQPDAALPMLRSAYATAEAEEARRSYAHILGVLNDPAGAETLLKAVAEAPWDDGWSFTGMGQFGPSLSEMDSLMIALARTGDSRALETILKKAEQLDAASAFSHHRAVAIALETLGRPEAAPALAALLAKPGMTGYACTDAAAAQAAGALPDPNLDRDRSIRELLLARALFRCGDFEEVGRKTLEAYAQDLRGHLARHAQAILGKSATAPPVSALDIEKWPVK